MTTVDSILKQFTKTVTKLTKHAQSERTRATNLTKSIDAMAADRSTAMDEAVRAEQIAANITKLLETN